MSGPVTHPRGDSDRMRGLSLRLRVTGSLPRADPAVLSAAGRSRPGSCQSRTDCQLVTDALMLSVERPTSSPLSGNPPHPLAAGKSKARDSVRGGGRLSSVIRASEFGTSEYLPNLKALPWPRSLTLGDKTTAGARCQAAAGPGAPNPAPRTPPRRRLGWAGLENPRLALPACHSR